MAEILAELHLCIQVHVCVALSTLLSHVVVMIL